MNKNLDHLFEQTRQSLQSDMPLKEVQELIHAQASPSLWTNQKNWIMITSIIGIITISTLLFFSNYNAPDSSQANLQDTSTTIAQNHRASILNLKEPRPDNLPLPVITDNNKIPEEALTTPLVETIQQKPLQKATKLDSLEPKETFTEYKLEIKKENSEEEIKKLKSELAEYGIHMDIQELSYNGENKIKKFKGKFKTDSLFCGSTMNDYQFDISGSFQSMEFIFRVSSDKNLKYLKIQSDDFEETIECYDDEVIANTKEAEKMRKMMKVEMEYAQIEIKKAQVEMKRAQKEMALAELEMERAREKMDKEIDWEVINKEIERAVEEVNIESEIITREVKKTLKNLDRNLFNEDFKLEMEALKIELKNMRSDIDHEVRVAIRGKKKHKKNKPYRIGSRSDNEKSAEELEEEAKALEERAEEMLKEAKEKAAKAKAKSRSISTPTPPKPPKVSKPPK